MEVSTSTSAKKGVAKRPPAAAKATAPVAARKPTLRKAKQPVNVAPPAEELKGLIAAAAYQLAAERGFAPGHEVDDWLAAEKQVLSQFP